MAKKDFYKVLGLERNATEAEIKKAFKKLSVKHHPDKAGGDSEKFKEINEAYQTLSDKDKKRAFDRGEEFRAKNKPVTPDFQDRIIWRFSDILNGRKFKHTYSPIIKCTTCDGVGSKNPNAVWECSVCDGTGVIRQQMNTPFGIQIMTGTCMSCGGKGSTNSDPCQTCKGKKYVKKEKTIDVYIKPGTVVQHIVTGEGNRMDSGVSDLLIQLQTPREGDFELRQDFSGKIFISNFLSLTLYEALLGCEKTIELEGKKFKLTIPKDSRNGTNMRLSSVFSGLDIIVEIRVKDTNSTELFDFVSSTLKESIDKLEEEGKDIFSKLISNIKSIFKK